MTSEPEIRFHGVFRHLGAVTAYAKRRGSRDPEAIAAEAMTIAWRRLADVPRDDPLPWLYATTRHPPLRERRRSREGAADVPDLPALDVAPVVLDPTLAAALRALSPTDREALLLIAWEDLTPSQAAEALGVNPTAFRVRLLRARRRLRAALGAHENDLAPAQVTQLDVEGT